MKGTFIDTGSGAVEAAVGIGHNSQAATPFDLAVRDVDLLWTESVHWLDGAVAETQAEADSIAVLLDMARKAKAAADGARKAEAKPFDDGKAEVQARYKPIITKCDTVADAAKDALAPFLAAQEAAAREAEAKARAVAEEARRVAREAASRAKGIEARARVDELADAAKRAGFAAWDAERARGKAKGGAKAVTLRTTTQPSITDLTALMRWIWAHDQSAIRGFAEQYVAGAYRAGQREMDGVVPVKVETVA
jgi:multidrug efflux pump subunit AcrA (membrane-fusion protein)